MPRGGTNWPFLPNVVRWEVSTRHFRITTELFVVLPIGPLALPATVFNHHATRADVQLRPGEYLATTGALPHLRDLLPRSPVQILQTFARGEALGHEFREVSAVAIRQLDAHLASPPHHHHHVGVHSQYLK